jgi:hypothetical protein
MIFLDVNRNARKCLGKRIYVCVRKVVLADGRGLARAPFAIRWSAGIGTERFAESFAEGDRLRHMLEGYVHAQAKRIAHLVSLP